MLNLKLLEEKLNKALNSETAQSIKEFLNGKRKSNMGNKYIDNAKIWSKERKFNERTLALQELIKIARKHYPQIVPIIQLELYNERRKITLANTKRLRMSIIGR